MKEDLQAPKLHNLKKKKKNFLDWLLSGHVICLLDGLCAVAWLWTE